MVLTQQAIGHIPQIFIGVDEIQDQAKVRKLLREAAL
jgi:hypothetical protein